MLFLLPISSQLPTWKRLTHSIRLNWHIPASLNLFVIHSEVRVISFMLSQCSEALVTQDSYDLFSYQHPLGCGHSAGANTVVCIPARSTEPESLWVQQPGSLI